MCFVPYLLLFGLHSMYQIVLSRAQESGPSCHVQMHNAQFGPHPSRKTFFFVFGRISTGPWYRAIRVVYTVLHCVRKAPSSPCSPKFPGREANAGQLGHAVPCSPLQSTINRSQRPTTS